QPVDDTKYNQADHWNLLVLPRLAETATQLAKTKYSGQALLNPKMPPSVWDAVKQYHQSIFQLETQDQDKFNGWVANGAKSKLMTVCISKATEIVKAEFQKVQNGQKSELFLKDDPDYASAKEHWQQAFLPLLVGMVNTTLSKENYINIMVATGGSGAAQMLEEFFKPLQAEHKKAYKTAILNGPVGQKVKDMPPSLQGIFSTAHKQLVTALDEVLKSKTNSTYFRYAPLDES